MSMSKSDDQKIAALAKKNAAKAAKAKPSRRRRYDDTLRSEEHTSELQSRSDLVCRLLLEKKKNKRRVPPLCHAGHPPREIIRDVAGPASLTEPARDRCCHVFPPDPFAHQRSRQYHTHRV